ncbi:Sensor protein ZraS [Stratiformator vulcanicus]|uniref:histidine kinase n=1 Tax=Stratiformator vulcanicus TaxID=2527980 RepID=A0A517R1U3_9PLAN|nr:Sensor protein ZraS [Stratiformator vulcanicus]
MGLGRSIRRKMAIGLAILLALIATSSLVGFLSLQWYHEAVQELDFTLNRMPHRSTLDSAIGEMFEPLIEVVPLPDDMALLARQEKFHERLDGAKAAVAEFWQRYDALPPSDFVKRQRRFVEAGLVRITNELNALDRENQQLPYQPNPERRLQLMIRQIGVLETVVLDIPDPQQGLADTVEEAVSGYDFRVRWFLITSGLVAILFMGLIAFVYRQVFAPLRRLHKGARRVAQGDFHYTIKMETGDEIAELAEAFNQMTARFREVRDDLDSQVQERSRQLVRSERLAGIGFLAAGVAHEINNPLSAISMAAESLEYRVAELREEIPEESGTVLKEYLGMMQRESFRCQGITRRLLDFARGNDGQRTTHDLNLLVGEVLEMVRHMSRFKDREIDFSPVEDCTAEVNGAEVKQVILNFVSNALNAMDAGRKLTISIESQSESCTMVFEDEGCGMCEETLENLFEPFFTKQKDGRGTGLGMSISHRIVSDHDGTIEVHSEGEGCGSTFRVRLPRKVAFAAGTALKAA